MRFAQKTTRHFLTILTITLLALIPHRAMADIGPDTTTPGGIITPGQKIDTIAMKDEKVHMVIKQGTGPFTNSYKFITTPETDRYYAHVTATFTMQNLTDQAVVQNMLFPFHYRNIDTEHPDNTVEQALNTKIKVNGQDVGVTYKNDVQYLNANNHAATGHFAATFTPKSDTTITVEYDLRGVQQPKRPSIGFEYMMVTGSHWAGNIGSGEVTVEFEGKKIDSKSALTDTNSFFNLEDGKLVWRFTNLEPTSSDDINVAFDPYILNTVWPKRQSFISGANFSTQLSFGGLCYDLRAQSECAGPGNYVNPSPINVIAAPDLGLENGWLAPQAQGATFNEWAEFTFDGKYTFDAIQIRSGVLYTTPDYTESGEAVGTEHYDTFLRPKNVVVTYDDNTTETFTLKDEPATLQSIPITKKASSRIKLSFTDNYNGAGNGFRYFGVGRIYFNGAQKIEAPAATNPAFSLLPFTFNAANWPIYAAIAAAIILVIGVIVFIIVRRRKLRQPQAAPPLAEPTGATTPAAESQPTEQHATPTHHTSHSKHKQKK